MKYLVILLISILIIQNSVAPPVERKDKKDEENEDQVGANLHYHRYLQEVVQALESDPDFRKKLENANESDIRDGSIAHELEFVNHKIRTQLDELKRVEIERLKHLATREFELENGLDISHLKIPEHLDDTNPHTFEIEDLKKLIAKTTKDLDEADRKRKEEFKEYEMHKKFEQEEQMTKMNDEEKKKFEKELHDMEVKHKEHEKIHQPGHKKQLEEVWEKQDHMENQEFDPRTFFFLHDLDGNGVWDPTEIKALFLKELDKIYAAGNPEDDLVERAEEMERMREQVIKTVDLNQDGLISYEEFLQESKKPEFEEDPEWKPLDEQNIYSEQEYEEYRRQHAKQVEQAISKAMSEENHPAGHPEAGQQFPPHPNQVPHQQPQYQVPQQPQYQVPQQQHYPQQGQYQGPPQQVRYNQIPQEGQYQQVPIQQGQHNQIPQQQQYNPNQQAPPVNNINQVPQQNQQIPAGQVPAQQQYQVPVPNQVPVPQQQYQQVHQQQYQQVPQQQYQQVPVSNQVPQQQYQQNQVPVQQNQVPVQQVQQNQGVNQQNTPNHIPAVNNAQAQPPVPQAAQT